MNLIPRRVIFWIHVILLLGFLETHEPLRLELLLPLLFHYLTISNDSSCYQSHCVFPQTSQYQDPTILCPSQECRVPRWMRMKHCFRCQRCIHKYDHHCVLMDICIGQFNHRYYLLFLFTFLWNTLVMVYYLTISMRDQVKIDEKGLQSFSWYYYVLGVALVLLYFNIVLTGYLAVHHLYFTSLNTTTWQFHKQHSIPYLKYKASPYSFNKGIISNFIQLFKTQRDQPIDWEPFLEKEEELQP